MNKDELIETLGELEDANVPLTSLYYYLAGLHDNAEFVVTLFNRVQSAKSEIEDAIDLAERILENMEESNELQSL
jgi:predicted transcriptional regulator